MVTYTTVDKVANILGFPNGYFTANSTPTTSVIETFIEIAEDEIDAYTGHAWRSVTITKERLKPSSNYRYGTGIILKLQNRKIRSIEKLEIWDGSSNIDWVATKTEGRNKDYWVDYEQGFIYLISLRSLFENSISCDYKFGETVVGKQISRIATLKTALEILRSPEFSSIVFTEGSQNNMRHSDLTNSWQKEINDLLDKHSEFKII